MILAAAFALAIVWSLTRGGDLARVAALRLRHNWMIFVAFGLQLYPLYFSEANAAGPVTARVFVLIGTYLLLLVYVWENRTVPGIRWLGIGLVANFAVMLLNGGYMPVTREALARAGYLRLVSSAESGAHVFATKDIVLPSVDIRGWFLSDIFVLPPPFPIPSVFSIGDLLIAVGIFLVVQHALREPMLATR
jgi:Family of unknown function (DUF5317)